MQYGFNQQPQVMGDDVYAGVNTSPLFNTFSDAQEFSIDSVSQKLGVFAPSADEAATATPDLMPSTQTINMSFARNYAPEQTATKVSSKTKAVVISYVAVVLMLVLAVTLCGVSVGNSFATAVAVESAYSEVATQLAEVTQVASQEDYAELMSKAQSLGYVDASASNTLTYTEVETRPAQNISVQTNWFDSLCDWLCGVFGA